MRSLRSRDNDRGCVKIQLAQPFLIMSPPKKVKKPGLSQARALIFPKDLVSLSNSISYGKDTL